MKTLGNFINIRQKKYHSFLQQMSWPVMTRSLIFFDIYKKSTPSRDVTSIASHLLYRGYYLA
jgi:hypothetical protein